MKRADESLHEQLAAVVKSYRRVHEEHRRAHAEGRGRRELGRRLEELAERLERLLAEPTLDDEAREEWRRHLYEGAPEPERPAGSRQRRAPHRPPRNRARGSSPLWQR